MPQGLFNVTFDVYRLPPVELSAPDSASSAAYVMNVKGYDCVVSGLQLLAYRTQYMNFLARAPPPHAHRRDDRRRRELTRARAAARALRRRRTSGSAL